MLLSSARLSKRIIARTIGLNYQGPQDYNPTYFDSRRNTPINTEFAETLDALASFKKDTSNAGNMVELMFEVSDLIFQMHAVMKYHSQNTAY